MENLIRKSSYCTKWAKWSKNIHNFAENEVEWCPYLRY